MTAEDFVRWRKKLGLTQAEAGSKLGVTRRSIQLYEAGTQPIPLAIALACSTIEATKISLSDRRFIDKQELLALVHRGTKVWNSWREEVPNVDPNLLAANLIGLNLREANLRNADLSQANLSEANLSEADLSEADLSAANLNGTNLTRANLSKVDLSEAKLSGALLHSASLIGANLTSVDLSDADLHDADLRQASLIDCRLDGANLTGTKLWETQRGGWSIKGVICQRAFWDRDGKEPTEYEDGVFERIYGEKPRIVLHYAGGMSSVDLTMLPLIVERLQADHPNSAFHIRSVQDEGSGATVTITVDDLAGQSNEAFMQHVEAMRADLATLQQRLQQEERLRLDAEARYRIVIDDVLPMLLNKALQETEIKVGQLTGLHSLERTSVDRDTYNIHGQAGVAGANAHAHDMTFQQVWRPSGIDLPTLAVELEKLHAAMKQETQGTREQDKAIVAVADAEEAAAKGDGQTTLRHLKTAGKWTLGIAEKIGVAIATEAIKKAM